MIAAEQLSAGDTERIYERCIRPDALDGIERPRSPMAVLVVCGPDAENAYALARVRANLRPLIGPSVLISAHALREYHPGWRRQTTPDLAVVEATRADVSSWHARLVEDALAGHLNLVVEVGTLDPNGLVALARRLKHDGYQVAGVALALDRDATHQAAVAGQLLGRTLGGPARLLDTDHEESHEAMRAALSRLEAEGVVDRLQIVARDGGHMYANEHTGQHWVNEPRAAYVLDDFQQRRLPARELADAALRWEVLLAQLQADASTPPELLERTVKLAQDTLGRAEADTEVRRMLAWGREAEAFRTMNRVAFLRAFPQHAKTVERYEEAVEFADKRFEDANDRRRFLERTRLELADRIALGRAPTADRGKPPPPAREPRTR